MEKLGLTFLDGMEVQMPTYASPSVRQSSF